MIPIGNDTNLSIDLDQIESIKNVCPNNHPGIPIQTPDINSSTTCPKVATTRTLEPLCDSCECIKSPTKVLALPFPSKYLLS